MRPAHVTAEDGVLAVAPGRSAGTSHVDRVAAAAAGGGAAGDVHALPGGGDALSRASSRPRSRGGPRCGWGSTTTRRWSTIRCSGRRWGTTSGSRSATIPAVDRAGAADGGVGERAASRGRGVLRLAYFTPTVLPMIAVANIWLFFYTPGYGLLEQLTGLARAAEPQLARQPRDRAGLPDRGDGVEGGGLLHDLLPGRAAVDPAAPGRGGGARGRRAAGTSSAA